MVRMIFKVLLASSLVNFSAFAEIKQSAAILLGSSTILGDLNPTKSRVLSYNHRYLVQTDGQNSWGIGIHMIRTETRANESDFPFHIDETVSILSFLFAPTFCHNDVLRVCAALGQGTVNANSKLERRDYGSWNYHLHASLPTDWGFNLESQLSYVGKVEMETNQNESEFAFTSSFLGASYYF
jgi:hypothetical protein